MMVRLGDGETGKSGSVGGRERKESSDSGLDGNSRINGDDSTIHSLIHLFMVNVASGES